MKDVEKIIKLAGTNMREMLASVLNYNKMFLADKKKEKLLEKILFAISVIDRKYFYSGFGTYYDTAMPIGEGQTISQPSTVARMLLLADLEQGDDVLEVGTGSGWNACLIAFLVYPGSVISVERLVRLKEKAENNLTILRNYLKQKKPQEFEKVEKINFYAESILDKRGKAWKRKYDKVIITAGINKTAEEKIENLAEKLLKRGGRLICPYVSGPLLIYKKGKKDKLERELTKEDYVFVPLLE